MAKSPKYFTVKNKDDDRKHRVLGGANKAGTAASASMKSASQSNASRGSGSGPRSGAAGSVSPTSGSRTGSGSGPSSSGSGGDRRGGGGGNSTTGPRSGAAGSVSPTSGSRTGSGSGPSSPSGSRGIGGGGGRGDLGTAGVPGGASRQGTSQAPYSRSAPVGSGFGPRAGADRTLGTVSPSQIAADAALNRIASGSSVISGAPGKMQERVPSTPLGGPNQGLGPTPAAPVNYTTAGANSPFADQSIQQYDPNTYNRPSPATLDTATKYPSVLTSNYADPNVGVSTLGNTTGLKGVDYGSLNTAQERALSKAVAEGWRRPASSVAATSYTPSDMRAGTRSVSGLSGPNQGLGYSPTAPGSFAGNVAAPVAMPSGSYFQSPPPSAPSVAKQIYDRAITIPGGETREISQAQMEALAPIDRETLGAAWDANQVPVYTPPISTVNKNPFYSSPAQQAADVRRAVALAQGQRVEPASSAVVPDAGPVGEADVPDLGPSNPVGQYISDKVADRFDTRVNPSQDDSYLRRADQALARAFGTPGPNSPYARMQERANDIGGRGNGGMGQQPVSQPYVPPPVAGPVAPPPPAMPSLPPYVNYQQLPVNYGAGVNPSQPIVDFANRYGGGVTGYADGGAVSDEMNFAEKMKWGMENSPIKDLDMRMFYAMGMPVWSKQSGGIQWHRLDEDLRRQQMLSGQTTAPKPKAPETPAPVQSQLYPQLSQYEMPPPSAPISQFNNGADVLGQQNEMFRLPRNRGGGVGDGIDAAIRIAKSFS